jgi:hypothetical protein
MVSNGLHHSYSSNAAPTPPCTRPNPAPQERLRLRGWRDAGGAFFRVEASSALLPDSLSVFEAERLLLAPQGAAWAPECLELFGLQSDLEVGTFPC